MIVQDFGICIRTVDYSDTSQVITVFCRKAGKISAIAKGAKRPKSRFGGAIEVLAFGSIVFRKSYSGGLCTLTEFEPRPGFMMLRNCLLGMNCALFGAELINHFLEENDPNESVFDCMVQFLGDIQQASNDAERLGLLIIFQLGLLNMTGTAIVLDRCANCKSSKLTPTCFSSEANGLVCRDCEMSFIDKTNLSAGAVKCLCDLKQIVNADDKLLYEIEKMLIGHISAKLGRKPRMAKYVL